MVVIRQPPTSARGATPMLPALQGRFEIANGGNHKQRGGYYTPAAIANLLAEWAITETSSLILEPSAGDGVLVEAAAIRAARSDTSITAIELYSDEAEKIRQRDLPQTMVVTGDFFEWFSRTRPDGQFDAAVGNPPFIRYHDFEEEHREPAFGLMRSEGLHPSRLTNAWVPFLVATTMALKDGGRFAFVVPAELLQVTYAAEFREYLARRYSEITVVTFRQLVFDGIQQETLLLLGVRGDEGSAEIRFVEVDDVDDLDLGSIYAAKPVRVALDHARDKWTRYYLSPDELQLIQGIEQQGTLRLRDVADVDVGIVTGRNEFFVLPNEEVAARGLREWCIPLVGRSAHIPGVVFRGEDWSRLTHEGARCFLLQLGDKDRSELPSQALNYTLWGEARGFHEKYKCRIRLPRWWSVPSAWTPDAFLLRQIHDGPRIIQNLTPAMCTDTIHRVRMHNPSDAARLASVSVNSLSWSFAELLGRSYGGGVLELEPTEAEQLPIPWGRRTIDVDRVDALARQAPVLDVLDYVDAMTLPESGLTGRDVETLRAIWWKLFQRRKSRKKASRVRR